MAAIAMAVYVRPPAGNLAAAVPPAAPIVRSLPAIEATPDAASGAARQQALELAWRGELGEAERLFRQAVAGDGGDVEAWHGLGVVLIRRGELGPGLDALRTALRLRPSHAEAHRNLGAALDRLGRRDEAIPHYRAFLALTDEGRPGRDDVRRRLGELGAAGGPA
jgi:Flp pilus assembly protein TadD